mmetsp:Transcript_97251/g.303310  ORF Transcript_97251/g.303310 Transcript_97251/m.303310 type:complete len:90 (-) Transcript_97251:255-524(-)
MRQSVSSSDTSFAVVYVIIHIIIAPPEPTTLANHTEILIQQFRMRYDKSKDYVHMFAATNARSKGGKISVMQSPCKACNIIAMRTMYVK